MNLPWRLLGTLTMLVVTAEGAQLIRNARRKRRAHALCTRVIAARDDDHSQRGAGKDSYTERHV